MMYRVCLFSMEEDDASKDRLPVADNGASMDESQLLATPEADATGDGVEKEKMEL